MESAGGGRDVAILTDPQPADDGGDELVPIVRTTSSFTQPAQRFAPIHRELIADIAKAADVSATFNNAMLELYARRYTSMRCHSDHSLDLQPDSCIAVFSCYESVTPHTLPDTALRRLIVQRKPLADGDDVGSEHEIVMQQNSAIVFSCATNRRYLHKIVSSAKTHASNATRWLGLTLRTSATLVRFAAASPTPSVNGRELQLASEAQRGEFYRLRRQENGSVTFAYGDVPYTISGSDLLRPTRV